MKNIILIGMPSSGKSTIGKTIAEKLNKTFVDMDDEIISYANMSIPDIFALKQEAGFREIETIITKKVAAKSNCVIATGGGVIKKAENIQYLKENGIIIFIDRDLSLLIQKDFNRPLSSSKEAVKKLYEERYMLYNTYADIIVKNNEDLDVCINAIIDEYTKFIQS